jgi:hypothetical protein
MAVLVSGPRHRARSVTGQSSPAAGVTGGVVEGYFFGVGMDLPAGRKSGSEGRGFWGRSGGRIRANSPICSRTPILEREKAAL